MPQDFDEWDEGWDEEFLFDQAHGVEEDPQELEVELLEQIGIGSDLSKEFRRQSSTFATWAARHARAEARARAMESAVDTLFSHYYRLYRKKHPDAKENDCKSFIKCHPKYKSAVRAFNAAKFDRDMLKHAVKAFEMRRDMLMQLGADSRNDMNSTDMNVRKQRASRFIRKTYAKGESNGR